jgi:hypothetical protein
MSRTLNQQMSDAHEADIAEWTDGRQPKASGSQWHDPLDVKNDTRTAYPLGNDGKATLGKSLSITREMWRKLREECFGHIPTWWGRFYQDESLRTVHLDLVALEVDDFRRILQAARNWERLQRAQEELKERWESVADFSIKGLMEDAAAEEGVVLPLPNDAQKWESLVRSHPQAEELVVGLSKLLESIGDDDVIGNCHVDYRVISSPPEYIRIEFSMPTHESGCDCCR